MTKNKLHHISYLT